MMNLDEKSNRFWLCSHLIAISYCERWWQYTNDVPFRLL